MTTSAIYQHIWETGVELPDHPGYGYLAVEDIVAAFPGLTPARLSSRCMKSRYMSPHQQILGDLTIILGWFIHVPPKNMVSLDSVTSAPRKTRPRTRAPLPKILSPYEQQNLELQKLAEQQRERIKALGWMACIPTIDIPSADLGVWCP
jgi:hypothetical protein